jgi:hypothetical protein
VDDGLIATAHGLSRSASLSRDSLVEARQLTQKHTGGTNIILYRTDAGEFPLQIDLSLREWTAWKGMSITLWSVQRSTYSVRTQQMLQDFWDFFAIQQRQQIPEPGVSALRIIHCA